MLEETSFKELLEYIEANRNSVIIKNVNEGTDLGSRGDFEYKTFYAGKISIGPYGVKIFNPCIIFECVQKRDKEHWYLAKCLATVCIGNKSSDFMRIDELLSKTRDLL